ncbi:Sister chromatid cohesion protein PDS5-like B-B [Spatholobus suberectus]|nr:Sister chromatid cohesion protein PDS5-like B-B [Spatholobus suberectus]
MTSPETAEFSERNTAKRLRHAGRKLLKCHSVDKLLQQLDKLELLLSTLEQEPTKPIQESLVPSMKALISDDLLRHTDEDVKISVTSCITEITRITAPDIPYEDEQMKEIFKLTVASFEKLSHTSGHGCEKALTILDNVNKVRLCLVMLDLECNDLVIEMFQHFLRFVRSNHPCNAIHSMESIMTLILQESEKISSDLLRPLLDSIGNENQTISPISWTLGKKVISNCAVKLKPYLMMAVESSGRALNEYAQIVTNICQNESESPQCDDSNGSKKTPVQEAENKLDVPKDAEEQPHDATNGHEPDISGEKDVQILDDTKSNIRSASASPMDGEAIKKYGSKRRPHSEITKNSKRGNAKANLETDNLEPVQEPKSETQLNTMPRKRGRNRKPNSLMNEEEGYDHSWIYRETKPGKSALSRKARNSSSAFPSSEKPTSRKDKLHRKPKTVNEALVSEPKSENIAKPAQSRRTHNIGSDFPPNDNPASSKDSLLSKPEDTSDGREALASKPKVDENTDAAPSINNNIPDGRCIKQGGSRKINSTGNQDVHSNSVSMLKEDNLNPLLVDTSLDSPAVRLEKESEVRKDSELKPIRKIKFSVKFGGKIAVAPESVLAKMEPNVSCGDEGKHKSSMNVELENKERGRLSAQTDVKKRRRLNVSPNKGLNKSSAVKELIAESASKMLSGVKETPLARLRRRHVTVNAEASESHENGNSLVGCRIKVWWPKDKT